MVTRREVITLKTQRLLIGIGAGISVGYALARGIQALRDRKRPYPTLNPDATMYGKRKRALALVDLARSTASLTAIAFIVADPLDRRLKTLPRGLRGPAFVLLLSLYETLREWPVAYIDGHVMERQYATSNQDTAAWAADHLKSSAIASVVGAVLIGIADAVVHRFPTSWPWALIAGTPPLLAFANVVAPTFVMPLFNTYEKLEGPLEARIRELAARYGVGNASILRFDMSRQTKKANAFVTGVFGTERIVLADTLIENFPEDETMFVVAHELGHYVKRDPWVAIVLGTGMMAATILLGGAALRASGRSLETPADGARFAFYSQFVFTIGGPLLAAASRAIERRADRFAVEATRDPQSGARAFRRLREQNLAEDEQPKWAELLFSSHPSLKSRIARLEATG